MKNLKTKLIALLFALSLLSACGGGGGGSTTGGGSGGDTMTVNIVSLSTPTTTTAYTGNLTTTPALFGMVSTQTAVEMASPAVQVDLCGNGVTAAPYSITTPYLACTGLRYSLNSGAAIFSSTTGTITLTSVGNVGQQITGSFDAIVSQTTPSNLANTLRIWGTFSVNRVM